jgi:hypothetical protein
MASLPASSRGTGSLAPAAPGGADSPASPAFPFVTPRRPKAGKRDKKAKKEKKKAKKEKKKAKKQAAKVRGVIIIFFFRGGGYQ